MSVNTAAPCFGKKDLDAHTWTELGECWHAVGGATYCYVETVCEPCGSSARRTRVFLCRTGEPAIKPTADNCRLMAWKAARP
jgi:hypothetical protein